MTQQPPPPGGWPPQPDSPTQPNYPIPAGGSPPPPPPPPPPGTGYPPPPGPPNTSYYAAPPPGPENHTSRNVVIGGIVALIAVLLIGGFYVASRPSPSFPVIIPTAKPSSEPTKTPKPSKQPATEEPTAARPTDEPVATPTEVAQVTPPPSEAPPTDEVPTDAVPTAEAPSEVPASPAASLIAGIEDQGIIVGEPVVIGEESLQQVAVLLQNNTDLVKSYSVKATYLNGDTITVSATGFVSDHLPGSIRVATLFFSGDPPQTGDVGSVQIDTMLTEDESTPNGDIAQQVTFGPPTFNIDEFFSSIDVQVTNGSDVATSIGVTAAILRDGELVGTGSGFANDMAAGQTKTASLFVTGDLEEDDDVILSVDTVAPTE
jgi:hypothetical protein